MSEFDYEAIKDSLMGIRDGEYYHGDVSDFAVDALAAIEALQAEAELGAKIAKLTGELRKVRFLTTQSSPSIRCDISIPWRPGYGYGDTPLQALNNAIDALGEG